MVMPPGEAPLVVRIVNVVEPEPVTVVGLKLPVTPEGNPDVPKFTVPLNPLRPVTVTVYAALPPAATLAPVGDALKAKSGSALTVRPNVTVTPEYLAVTVTGVEVFTDPDVTVKVATVEP
jgi:hypothetical protein